MPVVNSYNEWDPLEEVIVGVVDGAAVPEWHISLEATMPENQWDFYKKNGGKPFPQHQIDAAKKDLEGFVHILESEGVVVRRPDALDHTVSYATREWKSPGSLYAAMPRDLLLVFGDEIIEVPMAWRSRFFETHAYRRLVKEYFKKGARWTMAPQPQLSDELFNLDWKEPGGTEDMTYVITEFEPVFDAADFVKCGRDIFVQKSHVTNSFGIEWLRRHLGDTYRIHEIEVHDTHPMHIDASFMPLAPGKLLVNAERVPEIPGLFKSWDVLHAPQPCISRKHPLYMTSTWINMNVFMLDHQRVIVEQGEETIIKAFKDFGLKPIPCPFTHFNTFGGSFHCATLDIRRRGGLESYF
ncbi:MAG: amidinotransferase [bacterium]|nr:amidinotransferase [bacterium]